MVEECEMIEVGVLRKHPKHRSLILELTCQCTLHEPCFISLADVDRVIMGEWLYAKIYQKRKGEEDRPI